MDDAVDVLFRPWRTAPPGFGPEDAVLFLGARAHPDLALARPARVVAVQPFRPWAEALEATGLRVATDDRTLGEGHAAALVLTPPQQEVARAWLARAVLATREGGEVIACAPARLGGKRLADDLADLLGEVEVDVKARCRVVRGVRGPASDLGLAADWAGLDAPRPVLDGFVSQPGLFGWDRIDEGSRLLAAHLPATLGARVADAGCGFGWLAAQLFRPGLRELHLLEADARALDLAVRNLGPRAGGVALHPHLVDATEPWPVQDLDVVVTNPPFHVGGETDPGVGQAFLVRAHEALAPGGSLWLVANRHLPYERVLRERFGSGRVVVERGAFKVLHAEKAAAGQTRP